MVLKLSTGKSSKILIHGTSKTWHIPHDAWKIIKENHYEWTAHSHPTMTKIIASPEDRETLKLFTWQLIYARNREKNFFRCYEIC